MLRTPNTRNPVSCVRSLVATVITAGVLLPLPSVSADLSYLQSLLTTTPEGGWVKASTNVLQDAVAPPAIGGLPNGTYSDPGSLVRAWSAIAWDSNRGNALLWGGGHASYMGNEIYVWQGSNGTWTRGSLPSQLVNGGNAIFYVVDDAAPQSAHPYDNNVFLPVIDRFVSFGGGTFNTGGGWLTRDGNGNPVFAGPWLWNPARADANKVGGTTGSGYLPTLQGGEMWSNRATTFTGTRGQSPLEGTSAYRRENGKDVVYTSRDSNASGFPDLYRYEPGNPQTGELDRWDMVAIGWNASSAQSSAAIDSANGLYVRIGNRANAFDMGLSVWNLNTINPNNPEATRDSFVELAFANGARFETNKDMGIAYDDVNQRFVLWDGKERGAVYYATPSFDANGVMRRTWSVDKVLSTTAAQPQGNFANGVLGKWLYIEELDAFMALDEYQVATKDAAIWLYKPVGVVPETTTLLMMASGLALVFARRRKLDTARRKRL